VGHLPVADQVVDRLAAMPSWLPWTSNIWIGVSCENADYLWRLDRLRQVLTPNRSGLMEPLLGRLPGLDVCSIRQIIVGAGTGNESPDRALCCAPPPRQKQGGLWSEADVASPATRSGGAWRRDVGWMAVNAIVLGDGSH
jgi:Protein of unknown function (DUF5131)